MQRTKRKAPSENLDSSKKSAKLDKLNSSNSAHKKPIVADANVGTKKVINNESKSDNKALKKKFSKPSKFDKSSKSKAEEGTKNQTGKFNKKFGKGGPKFSNGKSSKDAEKPVWSEMKKKKKDLRLERRKAKTTPETFEIGHKAKVLAAQILRKVTQVAVRDKLCTELHNLMKGQCAAVALTHDLSRVIQVLLKHGTELIREQVALELFSIIVPMMQSKYATHSVKRMLKYGTRATAARIVERTYGSVVALAAHALAAPLLDFAYTQHATHEQKQFMRQEFYGDLYKESKEANVKTLRDVYADSPGMKGGVLGACKANIQRVIDKNQHHAELFHSVLYEYLRECAPTERAEMAGTLAPLVVPLGNSLPGANAAATVLAHATNKDKKTMVKAVKEHAIALATHRTGYRLLIALFHAVDDTVLLGKALVATLTKDVETLVKDQWGRMTLHWLVRPRDPVVFHPNFVKELRATAEGSAKKSESARADELLRVTLPPLCEHIAQKPELWFLDRSVALLTVAVLTADGASSDALTAAARLVCRPDWKVSDAPGVEDPGTHQCLKKLTAHTPFAGAVAAELTDETIQAWLLINRGCFLLVRSIKNSAAEVAKIIKDKIKSHLSVLKGQDTVGAKILLENM